MQTAHITYTEKRWIYEKTKLRGIKFKKQTCE